MLTLALLAAFQAAPANARPPIPADEAFIVAVQNESPDARIISHTFEGPAGTPAYRACGLIDIDGSVEPFSANLDWEDGTMVITAVNGVSIPPPVVGWEIEVTVPSGAGAALDWRDRNLKVWQRQIVLRYCPGLRPPEGTVWNVELEADPDPVRGERNRRRAAALTNMLFGGQTERSPAPATKP